MLIKGCNEEDFTNYRKTSMFVIFPFCDFKCDRENGNRICQNWELSKQSPKDVPVEILVEHYLSNPITKAVVCGGLEPMNSFPDLLDFLKRIREKSIDDFVIYTGYAEEEIEDKLEELRKYENVIVKFGRFRPGHKPHRDEVLGVDLASDNQYAKRIS